MIRRERFIRFQKRFLLYDGRRFVRNQRSSSERITHCPESGYKLWCISLHLCILDLASQLLRGWPRPDFRSKLTDVVVDQSRPKLQWKLMDRLRLCTLFFYIRTILVLYVQIIQSIEEVTYIIFGITYTTKVDRRMPTL